MDHNTDIIITQGQLAAVSKELLSVARSANSVENPQGDENSTHDSAVLLINGVLRVLTLLGIQCAPVFGPGYKYLAIEIAGTRYEVGN